ncbi:myosin-2 [Kryptolebias marmoratus]|uniref:myosin-2 n=1 Tax=Kryptolebias marmoratus TaxID=37003 RepID=UPI0007F8B9A9|nr:myosin-2 [Kryptolebias marmoratus]
MALCLVPDFPAVLLALEHLKELDRQLREEDGVPFAAEASVHLAAVTAAVSELEAGRRAAHEHLEVETIENSKLRRQVRNMSDRMSEEIMADIAAARASNAEEIEQLRRDLSLASHLQEEAGENLQALLHRNKTLQPDLEQVKAWHGVAVADLNDQINLKYNLQMQLDQKLQLIQELESSIAAVQQDKISLQQNVVLEGEAYKEKKDSLSRETDETVERIKLQEEAIKERREELDRVDDEKEEALWRLDELSAHVDQLESDLQMVAASRSRCEQLLEEEARRNKEVSQQLEMLKKESHELKEAFSVAARKLQEEIATVERKMEEDRASGLLLRNTLSQIGGVFKHRRGEENEVRAEHAHVSQQLERSKLQLEERIASIVVYSKDIKKIEKEIEELREAEAITRRVFERNQEELLKDLETTKDKISQGEEDKRRFSQLLVETKSWQEEHVEKMTSDISHARRRYEELLQEETALLQLQPKSADTDFLSSHVTQTERRYREMENLHQQEVQQITAEIQNICRSTEEKQRELQEREETLKEVEAKWTERWDRHDRLTGELSRRQAELELWIQNTQNQTGFLLRPRENLKAELEKLLESYTDTLNRQSSELRAAEVSIYNDSAILEQVQVENSQMLLRIGRMTEDLRTSRQEKEQYQQEDQTLQRKTKDTLASLQETWRQDVAVNQKGESRDNVLLVSMDSLWNRLRTREKLLMDVSTVLHQNMLDFSRRLGDRVAAKQQN